MNLFQFGLFAAFVLGLSRFSDLPHEGVLGILQISVDFILVLLLRLELCLVGVFLPALPLTGLLFFLVLFLEVMAAGVLVGVKFVVGLLDDIFQ
jgi:hypothetical protein